MLARLYVSYFYSENTYYFIIYLNIIKLHYQMYFC